VRFCSTAKSTCQRQKRDRSMRKTGPFSTSPGILNDCFAYSLPFCGPGSARSLSLFRLVENFAHHAAECRGAIWFLQLVGVGRDGHNAFRILRIAAGKKNGHTRKQSREPRRHGWTGEGSPLDSYFLGRGTSIVAQPPQESRVLCCVLPKR